MVSRYKGTEEDRARCRSYYWRNRARILANKNAGRDKAYRLRELIAQRKRKGFPAPTRPAPICCECCGKPCVSKKAMALDHDHETGAFRGWLCLKCNMGIGALGDNRAGVLNALRYLDKNSG